MKQFLFLYPIPEIIDFEIGKYPTYDARKHQGHRFKVFIDARKERSWLWQNY